MLAHWVWLIPLLPFLAAIVIAARMLLGRDKGDSCEPGTARLASWSLLAAWLGLVALDVDALLHGVPGHVRVATWFATEGFRLPISFTLDELALGVSTVLAFLIWLTHRFAANYLHREPGFHRFFFALSLFGAGMLTILLAGNAVLAFVGWEMAGVSSYLLIGYAYERQTATGNALRAFVTNRVGDAGFVLGIALAVAWVGSVEWPRINGDGGLESVSAGLLALGFALAALAKSGQVPFSPWIARALEGPTPSSAIYYGAVMVHAGVYLLLRLEPLLQQSPAMMTAIAVLGGLTVLYSWLSGLVQGDVKSALIFATTTQVGIMFLCIGVGQFEVVAWHMVLHAIWRAYQFLASPSYMHLVNAPAAPPPAWLARCQRLYTAALQRFWLEGLTDKLLVRPTVALGRDVRAFDDGFVSRLVGLPEQARAAAILEGTLPGRDEDVTKAHGLLGEFMAWLAGRLHRFEVRLVLQPGGGVFANLMQRLGEQLLAVETLLERPRYLLLVIMATLVVIL
jgi:NADH:ubiquinone oxidoreductase subunit 5 (subunit L)/multisubunit Na+/H+ antiporter MnhA subunit